MIRKTIVLLAAIHFIMIFPDFSFARVKVVVSFNALKEFTGAVGGDLVEIKTIIPDGVEPHDFEPKASDLVALSSVSIFAYNGLDMEPWVEKSLRAVNNRGLVVVVASNGIAPVKNLTTGEIKENRQFDPHVWLSLKGAEIESKNIKDALIKVDPANKDKYEKNFNDFYEKLENLYKNYKAKFDSVNNKTFVTGHSAFTYLAEDFGLKQSSVEDVFAEGEPSAKKLSGLIEYCRKNRIKTIFVEQMVSPRVSETLAGEVGAKVERIYTIESSEDNKDYLSRMNDNLDLIYESLK